MVEKRNAALRHHDALDRDRRNEPVKVTQAMLDAAHAALPALGRDDAVVVIQAALDADPTIAAIDAYAARAFLLDSKAAEPSIWDSAIANARVLEPMK